MARGKSCTITGRIVYNRPLHVFRVGDVNRIAKSILEDTVSYDEWGPFKTPLWQMLLDVAWAISAYLLRIILDLIGQGAWTDFVLAWLVRSADWLIGEVAGYLSEADKQRLCDGLVQVAYQVLPEGYTLVYGKEDTNAV